MENIILNNGIKMPILGFGVFQISKEDCKNCVKDAIKVGYRLIDTAQSYFNEEEVGDAINECINESIVKREDLFITSKVWIDNYGYDNCKNSVLSSMKKLKVDYIDLMLLHQPFSDYYGAYRALEDLYREHKLRSIGISNFYPDRLSDICAFNEIIPQINQVEVNPFNQQIDSQKNMEKNHVQIEAWAPFAEGKSDIFSNKILEDIGKNYNKTVAQVILRWLVQRKIVVLAKTTNIVRMKENIDIFDFELTEEETEKIKSLDQKTSSFFNHQTPKAVELFLKFIDERRNK